MSTVADNKVQMFNYIVSIRSLFALQLVSKMALYCVVLRTIMNFQTCHLDNGPT